MPLNLKEMTIEKRKAMSLVMKEIANQALTLPPDERAQLAHELIASLDDAVDEEAETAWEAEIGKRVQEIKRGKAKGRPLEAILAEIQAKYS
ncbi:MAG: addiction module protein [Candidatus Omnitrophota bacterium]